MTTDEQKQIAESTLRYDCRRAIAMGFIESGVTTFFLLILVRWFNGNSTEKALVSSAHQAGLLLTPFAVYAARRMGWNAGKSSATCLGFAALLYWLAALLPGPQVYVWAIVAGTALTSACAPFYTVIYQNSYPAECRGKYYAIANTLKIGTSVIAGALIGYTLSGRLYLYPLMITVFAVALTYSALLMTKYPATTIPWSEPSGPLAGFRYIKEDSVFRNTLICWMILGFGTLMALPLRVEYLASPQYGLSLSEAEVAILVTTIPNLARIIMSRIWGFFFDRVNFFVLRIILNLGFLVGHLSFFFSDSWLGLIVGALAFGISISGGDLAWNLWVTKFSPPERVADYMSVHTFLTGVRGLLAPLLGFYLSESIPLTSIALISGLLIVTASLGMVPEAYRHRKAAQPVSI